MSRARLQALRNVFPWLLLTVPLVLLLLAGFAVFHAQRALSNARQAARDGDRILFTWQPFRTEPNLRGVFEPVASHAAYTAGVLHNGSLYLAGPAGLTVLGQDGASQRTLRTGLELPVAPITALAVGRLRGASAPQVLITTGGAGLLVLSAAEAGNSSVRQLLPSAGEERDLTTVATLATGDLLLGTRHHGVLLYNGTSVRPFRFSLSGVDSAGLEVTSLTAIDAASFLIGSRKNGVFYAHAGTVEHCGVLGGLPDDQVEATAVAGRHAYVGTPVGTAEFDLDAAEFRPARILGPGLFAHALQVDGTNLDIGTLDEGVQQVPLESRASPRRVTLGADLPRTGSTRRVNGFVAGPRGVLALGDGELMRRSDEDRDGSWRQALASGGPSLTDRTISALAFTPDGTLFIGFFDRGVDLLRPADQTIRHLEDDHLFCINRLVLDPQRKTMAAATANGVVLFDAGGSPRQVLTRHDGLISEHVTDIAFTPTGTALATPAGITFVGPNGTESLYAFQGLVNNHVYALAAGGDELAAGTLGGLSLLQGRTIRHSFTVNDSSLRHNWITALAPMPDGGYLVGTYGAGLETLDRAGHFTPVELPAGAPHDLVINPNAIFATSQHLYAGTLGHGFLMYTAAGNRWTMITEGLPSLNVTAFAERSGELYIGTENGLVRIAEAKLP